MPSISKRELRDEISAVLQRAEAGEHIVVTDAGRPVAQLGPIPRGREVPGAVARAALADLPRPAGFLDDLHRAGGSLDDPFVRRPA